MCTLAYVVVDVFGIVTLLFFWQNQRRFGNLSIDDQLFDGILLAAMVEQLMDAGQWLLDGASFAGSYTLQVFSYTLGHALAPLIICLWAMYCDIRTNMDENGLKRRVPLYFLPMALHWLLLIANLFTPLVFTIDAAHVYHRGRYFVVYMALMFFYGLVSLLWLARKAMQRGSTLERTEYRSMTLFLLPPFIGGVLQSLFYGVSLIWISVVLSIIMVYTNVLNRQISTDPLTGLNNRRKLNQYLDMKINAADANGSIFLMLLDADGFKCINDQFGHGVGDRALITIADILKSLGSAKDCFFARLGGDEFVIVGHERDGLAPEAVAEQIEAKVAAFNQSTKEPFRLSLSIGWTRFHPELLNTTDALLNAADECMYRVKITKQAGACKAPRVGRPARL